MPSPSAAASSTSTSTPSSSSSIATTATPVTTSNDGSSCTTLRQRRPSHPTPLLPLLSTVTLSHPSAPDQEQVPPPRPPRSPKRSASQPKLRLDVDCPPVPEAGPSTLADHSGTSRSSVDLGSSCAARLPDTQRTHTASARSVLESLSGRTRHKHRRSLSSLFSHSTSSPSGPLSSSHRIRLGSIKVSLAVGADTLRSTTLPVLAQSHPFPNLSIDGITPSLRRELSSSLEALERLEMLHEQAPQVRLIKPSLPPQADPAGISSVSEGTAPSLAHRRSNGNLPIVHLPAVGKYTALFSPTTPASSTILLRPAPPSPTRPHSPPPVSRWSSSPAPPRQRFALAASLRSSRSNLDPQVQLSSASRSRPSAPALATTAGAQKDLVEIPRFKKRDLNLGIVRKHYRHLDWERLGWISLWIAWLGWALIGIFFDANILYMLVQCAQYPSSSPGGGRNWTFGAAAFALALFFTIFGIWLGWEVGYEFWRRWRAPRPAIEPIYLSLPASLHLSLISFPHFSFLKHVRASALGTPHAMDVIPETCYLLAQTLAPTIMLLPRAALAIVLLVAYSSQPPAPLIGTGTAGSMGKRDPRFFSSTKPGQLTTYSRGFLIAFVGWAGFRVGLLLVAWLGLWLYSGRPLAGVIGDDTCCFPGFRKRHCLTRGTTQRSLSHRPSYDPSIREVPEKSWRTEEDELLWAWRERTRARIQDAFELCLVRKGPVAPTGFLNQSISWGAARWREEQADGTRTPRSGRSPTEGGHVRTPTEAGLLDDDLLAIEALPVHSPDLSSTEQTRPRPKSGTLPSELPRPQNPSHSRDPSGSSLPWARIVTATTSETGETTPRARSPEASEEPLEIPQPKNVKAAQSQGPSAGFKRTPTPQSSIGSSKEQFYTPGVSLASSTSSFGSPGPVTGGARSHDMARARSAGQLTTEFGVSKRASTASSSEAGEGDDDSVALLSSKTLSPHGSISTIAGSARDRSRSASAGSRRPSVSGSHSTGSQSSRARSATTAALSRARSSSISLLQKSLAAAAAASDGGKDALRRARSGTLTSHSSLSSVAGYKRAADDDDIEEVKPVITPTTKMPGVHSTHATGHTG